MNNKLQKLLSIFLSLLFVAAFTLGYAPYKASAAEIDDDIREALKEHSLSKEELLDLAKTPEELVRVIVQLDEEPAVKNENTTVESVLESQEMIKLQAMELDGANIRHSYGYIINGFSMEVKNSQISKLKKMSGVKNVTVCNLYKPDMSTAKELTQAYDVWNNLGYKGEGTVVSVIDTGIDVSHKDMRLSDESSARLDEDYVNYSIKRKGLPGKYYTSKVPYAYNYRDINNEILDRGSMHGMHVAGIIGANCESEEEIEKNIGVRGVAPECQIMSMKVFSNDPSDPYAYTDDIVAAIEDSIILGADVINMSLGGTAGFMTNDDPEQEVIKNAVNLGIIVVVSAGNSDYSTYPYRIPGLYDTGLIGSPGIAEDALQVASLENNVCTTKGLDYTSDTEDSSNPIPYSQCSIDPVKVLNNSEGCEVVECGIGKAVDFKGKDVHNKIALVKRGNSFVDSQVNAEKNGALGLIVYNDEARGDALINMAEQPGLTIPALFIGNTGGTEIKNLIEDRVRIHFNGKYVNYENPNKDGMSDFTSWGAAPNLEFKPEITGVGGQIWSTANTCKGGYMSMSGTSMSSPHVAGAEALIAESLIKDESLNINGSKEFVEFAKATSINTAVPVVDKYHNDVPYSPRRQGAGLIQIEDAINNRVLVNGEDNKPTIALKEIRRKTSFEVTLKNYSDEAATYNVSSAGGLLTEYNDFFQTAGSSTFPFDTKIENSELTFNNEGETLAVDGTNSITVPADDEITLTFNATLPNNFAPDQFVEGFIRFESVDSNIPSVGIPFMGFYGNWNDEPIIDAPTWSPNTLLGYSCMLCTNGSDYYYSGYIGDDDEDNPILDPDAIGISPNNDGNYDNVIPYMYFLRNARRINGEILDSDGNIIAYKGEYEYIRKPSGLFEKDSKPQILDDLMWDGKLEDGTFAPDGQYFMNIAAVIDYDGAEPQPYIIPVKVDSQAPEVKVLSDELSASQKYTLKWNVTDLTGLKGMEVLLNGKALDKIAYDKESKEFNCELELNNGSNEIKINVIDYLGNSDKYTTSVNWKDEFKFEVKDHNITDDSFNIIFTAKNSTQDNEKATLILAEFDDNNRLLSYNVTDTVDINAGSSQELNGEIAIDSNAAVVKCFIWNNVEDMIPLNEVVEFQITK
jgi:lactocepin